jgi:hypothetical protein
MPLIRGADNRIEYRGPVKASDNSMLDNAGASATGLIRLFNERKEHLVAAAQTRLRADVAVSGSTFLIPHIIPAWLDNGDTISIVTDEGQTWETTISSYTAGTGKSTPSTNFDTIVVDGTVPGACAAGAIITLKTKVAVSKHFPVITKTEEMEPGDVCEIESDTGISDDETIFTIRVTQSSEDGETAANQAEYKVVTFVAKNTQPVSTNVPRRIRVKIGADITMDEYPVPPVAATWIVSGGFEAVIPDTLLGPEHGDLFRIECHFNGGAGLQKIISILEPVVEG